MGKLADIVFDARHAGSLARFWAEALDEYEIEPYDDDEMARLKAMGIDDIMDDPGVAVRSKSGTGVRYFFQNVPEGKTAKNRVHLDLRGSDRHAEVERLVALGATVRAEVEHESGQRWATMVDPEGNEFCVLDP